MPMPIPSPNERHDEFMSRCMGDETMMHEMNDPAQRQAVCEGQWEGAPHSAAKSELYYQHLVSLVRDTPWAILPESLQMISSIFTAAATGHGLTAEELQARIGAAQRPRARRRRRRLGRSPWC